MTARPWVALAWVAGVGNAVVGLAIGAAAWVIRGLGPTQQLRTLTVAVGLLLAQLVLNTAVLTAGRTALGGRVSALTETRER